MNCAKCGEELDEKSNFCKNCGEKINKVAVEKKIENQEKTKVIKKQVKRPMMRFLSSFTLALSIALITFSSALILIVEGQTKYAEAITKEISDEVWELYQDKYKAKKNRNPQLRETIYKELEYQEEMDSTLSKKSKGIKDYTKSKYIKKERTKQIEELENIIPIDRTTILFIGLGTLVAYIISKQIYKSAQKG